MINKVFVISLFAFFIVSCDSGGVDENTALSNIQLSNIRDSLNIWGSLDKSTQADSEVKSRIAESVLKNVMLVRSLKPSISQLGGEGLEILCLLMESEGQEILSKAKDKEVLKLGNEYLSSIEKTVRSEIISAQKSLKGKGCYISPE